MCMCVPTPEKSWNNWNKTAGIAVISMVRSVLRNGTKKEQ